MNAVAAIVEEEVPMRPHCTIGLIVTGKGERDFLPDLFRTLMKRAGCSFRVLRRIGQRSHITSAARRLRMVGTGQTIPTADEQDIGLPTRSFLRNQQTHFVILIDDVERDRRPFIAQVFQRYRTAMDTMLQEPERARASVHFVANMLEAYYFGRSQAVNTALGCTVLAEDWSNDVEEIGHPKNELKNLFPGFDERAHGALIVSLLDLDLILSKPKTCAFLRSLFGWCVRQLSTHAQIWDNDLSNRYELQNGIREALTNNQ